MTAADEQFPTAVAGLPAARPTEIVQLADGEEVDLRIAPVAKRLGDATVRMLAYNGTIPGPTLRVREGSEVVVNIDNEGDLEATVHWHGLRLENRYDGTHETQQPMAVGQKFAAHVAFPDAGVYWYHPHIREDYGQEMGLYGNVIVEPADPDYWPPAHREIALTLDDILIEDGKVAPFSPAETTHVAMGRFGNVLLAGGETDLSLVAQPGEIVRFYLTNTANTRVFRVALPGARMKLVGGDSGRVEREEFVEDVVIAPSERVVVDVLFEEAGELTLEHRTPERTYRLGSIHVAGERAEAPLQAQFDALRMNADMAAERERIGPYLDAEPDKKLAFIAEMDMGAPEGEGPVVYACPMHPDIVRDEPGHCPKCGMKLLPVVAPPASYTCPMHPEVVSEAPGHCPKCGMKLLPAPLVAEIGGGHEHGPPEHGAHEGHSHGHGEHSHATAEGIEWEDDMVEVNRMTTPANMRWKLIDRDTDAENAAIDWRFRVGDQVKIRLLNEMAGDHPMHHPFHVHGAGRFLVLSRDGVVEPQGVQGIQGTQGSLGPQGQTGRQGVQGIQGPQGPGGPPGPIGPPGTTTLSALTTFEGAAGVYVFNAEFGEYIAASLASCAPGERVVSGGSGYEVAPEVALSFKNKAGTGWIYGGFKATATGSVFALAYCAKTGAAVTPSQVAPSQAQVIAEVVAQYRHRLATRH